MARAPDALTVDDDRRLARRRVPHFLFEYVDGGSFDEVTLRENVAAMARVRLRQQVLVDVSAVDTATTLWGQRLALPVALAPVGIAGLLARRGEAQAARAAGALGLPFALSSLSICSIEEVRRAKAGPLWFQLYMIRDRGFMRDLLARAAAAGSAALVFTVDLPVAGARHRDVRSGLAGKDRAVTRALQGLARPGWLWDVGVGGRPHSLGNLVPKLGHRAAVSDFWGWIAQDFDPSVTWRDLDWLRAAWRGPLVIKGILDPQDAQHAVTAGAEGIVVSNHGGRQLDGVPPAIDALPAIADAVGDRTVVLMDGGIRTGLDVVRALARGAKGVLIGRAWAYALAAGGEARVRARLERMRREMIIAMSLTGSPRLDALGRHTLA